MDVNLSRVESEAIPEYKERCLRTFIEYIEANFILRHKFEVLYSDDLFDETKCPPLGLIDETKVPEDGSLLCITKDKVFYCFSRTIMMGKPKFYRLPLEGINELLNEVLTRHITEFAIYDLMNMNELPTDLPYELKVRLDRLKELKQVQREASKKAKDLFNAHYEGMSRIEIHRDMMAHFKSGDVTFLKKFHPNSAGAYDYAEESSSLAIDYLEDKLDKLIQSDIAQKINEIVFNQKSTI